MIKRAMFIAISLSCTALVAFVAGPIGAQAPAAPAPPMKTAEPTITDVGALAWLGGCWGGTVNQRDFREQWSPLRGGALLGVGSTVFEGKLQSYEYLRIEPRVDGVYYVAIPSGQKEDAFRLVSVTTDDKDTIFTFSNPEHDFPQRIIYRRATEGWLYATIEGKLKGEDRQVIYPMRHIDCESGTFITK
jgi:hypothetical protein